MYVIPYSPHYAKVWDALVSTSRNGTFLLLRQFMDYHADRFTDVSLIFYKGVRALDDDVSGQPNDAENQSRSAASKPVTEQPLGVLPASAHGTEVVSHGGLTYGGFILSSKAHATDVGEMLQLAVQHFRAAGFLSFSLKPVPHIYHSQPSDDVLYWLFRQGAQLSARSLSTAISLDTPLPFSTLRQRKVRKATRHGITIAKTTEIADFRAFWALLAEVLMQQHAKVPVHSLSEILLLHERFPHNIQLYLAKDTTTSALLAGTLLFVTHQVIHAQYIAASPQGRAVGALDLLFKRLVDRFTSAAQRYLDFGISTEDAGRWLNEGLNFQKEGFGGRSIVYDTYTLALFSTPPN